MNHQSLQTDPIRNGHSPSIKGAPDRNHPELTDEAARMNRIQDEIDLGPIDFIPVGEGRAYTLKGSDMRRSSSFPPSSRTIAVFRQRDGKLFATDHSCPHRAGPLADGIIGGDTLICPLHMWKFDLRTGKCVGEDARLRTYPVREHQGRIRVSLAAAV